MKYPKLVEWLYAQLPMYQQQGKSSINYKLDNIKLLCAKLGNPQDTLKTIHIAGTNGKGSTSHILASVFQASGHKTGLYTSPHLLDFRERIKIDGKDISEKEVLFFFNKYDYLFSEKKYSFFEMTVALAFYFFSKKKVDVAIIEVGLGGRLDSTNIIKQPILSIITKIDFDHKDILGNSIEEIATEKAGIIKENTPVLLAKNNKIINKIVQERAIRLKSRMIDLLELSKEKILKMKGKLVGEYQFENIQTVYSAADFLSLYFPKLAKKNIEKGIKNTFQNTKLRGRWEIFSESPKVILDVGHNESAFQLIVKQLKKENKHNLYFILGFVQGKDYDKILDLLPKENAFYHFCKPKIERGISEKEVCDLAKNKDLNAKHYAKIKDAYLAVIQKAGELDVIFIGGSTFIVSDFLLNKS